MTNALITEIKSFNIDIDLDAPIAPTDRYASLCALIDYLPESIDFFIDDFDDDLTTYLMTSPTFAAAHPDFDENDDDAAAALPLTYRIILECADAALIDAA